jgi:hypothetical protein
MSERTHGDDDQNEANQPHTQPADDSRGPVEYLGVVVDKQLHPNLPLDADEPAGWKAAQSDLVLREYARGQDGTRRLRLRLVHPDSTESDISPMLTPAEMDLYLRGLIAGERGEIARKAALLDGRPDDDDDAERVEIDRDTAIVLREAADHMIRWGSGEHGPDHALSVDALRDADDDVSDALDMDPTRPRDDGGDA